MGFFNLGASLMYVCVYVRVRVCVCVHVRSVVCMCMLATVDLKLVFSNLKRTSPRIDTYCPYLLLFQPICSLLPSTDLFLQHGLILLLICFYVVRYEFCQGHEQANRR